MEKKIGKIIIIILVALALLTAGIFAYIKFSESNKIYREMNINNDEGTLSYNDLTVKYKKGEYLYFNASKNNMKNMLLYNSEEVRIFIYDKSFVIVDTRNIYIIDSNGNLEKKITSLEENYDGMELDSDIQNSVKLLKDGMTFEGAKLIGNMIVTNTGVVNNEDNNILDCNVYSKHAQENVKGIYEMKYLGDGKWDDIKNIGYTSLKDTNIKCIDLKENSDSKYTLNLESDDNSIPRTGNKLVEAGELTVNTILNYLGYVPRETIGYAVKDAYTTDSISIDEIDNDILFRMAMNHTQKADDSEEFEEYLPLCAPNKCKGNAYYKASNILDASKKMYNKEIELKTTDVPGGSSAYVNNYFINQYGKGSYTYVKYFKVLDAQVKDDLLIIREKALFYDQPFDLDGKYVVSKRSNIDENNPDYKTTTSNSYNEVQEYLKNNINNADTFKHTFIKNSDGTYYYSKTEVE